MSTQKIIIFVLVCLMAAFALLGWRVFYLQHCRADDYGLISQRQRRSIIREKPQRGMIVDRCGRIIAASSKTECVFVEPRAVADPEEAMQVASRLQELLDMPAVEICDIIYGSKNPGFVKVKGQISPAERVAVEEARIGGVGILSSWERSYPMGALTSHVTGFTSVLDDSGVATGLAGVELKYDPELRGIGSKDVFVVDVLRRPIGKKNGDGDGDSVGVDGLGVILTIDATIQEFARAAIVRQVESYNAESGTVIVMDPWTGEILALVSVPDFAPDNFSKASEKMLKNCALTDPFEPGSIFKPIAAAIGLDAGAVGYNEKIYCEDGYYGKYRIGEFASHRFGNMTVKEILVKSSNIGMAKIGQKLGRQKLYDGVRRFGFGARTGVDLPGEDAGLFYPVSKWSGYSVTRIPFGHEISVTSLQVIRAYAALANGGSIVRPHLLRGLVDSSGEVRKLGPGKNLAGRIIDTKVANWVVREALTGVVKDGTGKQAAIEGVEVFGKTGTANIAGVGGYDTTNYIASFAGGAPAGDPKVVILVSIRKPDRSLGKGYSGGRVAAQVFREILEKTLNYLERE